MQNLPNSNTLILVRHGIAVDRNEFEGNDSERALTERGQVRTRAAMGGLCALETPKFIISSDSLRAMQTGEILADAAEAKGKSRPIMTLDKRLNPNHGPADFDTINWAEHFSTYDCIAVVGHEPYLSELLCNLADMDIERCKFKKAGIALLEGSPAAWQVGVTVTPRILRSMSES